MPKPTDIFYKFPIPSTTKDNNADYQNESRDDAKHNSNTNGSCKCYIITADNWSLHNVTCAIHMKAYNTENNNNTGYISAALIFINRDRNLQMTLFWSFSSLFYHYCCY